MLTYIREPFKRQIVERKKIEPDVEELTLECGHIVIVVCPTNADWNYCAECCNEWIDKNSTLPCNK